MRYVRLAPLFAVLLGFVGSIEAQRTLGVPWIWTNEGDPARQAAAEARFFRKVFDMARPVDEAFIDLTADKAFTLAVNGQEVGKGDNPKRVYRFDLAGHLVVGKNVVAVTATGSGGPSGLLARISFVPNGQSVVALTGDASWKTSKTKADGWDAVAFDDGKWDAAKVLGQYGKVGPWKGLVWDAGGDDRFAVPPGFRVEQVVKEPLSLVNMCFDDKGRLLVSKEQGPILLCTDPDKDGVLQKITPYCEQVKNCQGMCWVKDSLLLVGNGPQGTGLYRCKPNAADDKIDKVEVLHKFRGGMGEHGPHAIIHGPDDMLYLVIGNHSWATVDKLADNSPLRRWPTGAMGPDQGKPGTTEDVLLPRQNDSRGHAANILAPGGTIWRLDHDGKNVALVAAGFRNHYDASFNTAGELFTFDSDMEWDEALPWYRHVRVAHCTPGADFVWRTGAANTPDWYLDSLPPLAETGRGSPVGTELYEHFAYPEKYRGQYFMADWSIGVIWAVPLQRDGASFKGKPERFCSGAPMNVTDLAVAPDGSLYFTLGGRGTQGGVYRIVYTDAAKPAAATRLADQLAAQPQPLAAWSRKQVADLWSKQDKAKAAAEVFAAVNDKARPAAERVKLLTALHDLGATPDAKALTALAAAQAPEVRAQAVYLLGVSGGKDGEEVLVKALKDDDAVVRRRACEALVRAGIEPPADALSPLLAEKDRFVRTAARLVLERIDPALWADRFCKEDIDIVAFEGIIALCKINKAAPYAEQIFTRLNRPSGADPQAQLDHLRTIQLALIHAAPSGAKPKAFTEIADQCYELFPQKDARVNRELAILLAHYRKEGVLTKPVHEKLLQALLAAKDDRAQQIHLFYCLRFLHQDWTPEQKDQLLAWFETTKAWTGGHSFTPFLENILRDANPMFTAADRVRVIGKAKDMPRTASVLLKLAPPKEAPEPKVLVELYNQLASAKGAPGIAELKTYVLDGLANSPTAEAQTALRKIADKEAVPPDPILRAFARNVTAENWPYLVRGLKTTSPLLLVQVIDALKKSPIKPKPEDGTAYRNVLTASERLDAKNRWEAVLLLRHWAARSFGAEKPDQWKEELTNWGKWFNQSFPKEPPLPNLALDIPAEGKYKFTDLLAYLEKDPVGSKGDAARGRLVFEKGQCIKCHKYGTVGEGLGPDLTTLSKRFKRTDTLESLIFPSKIISDQYRSVMILTKSGQALLGLAAPQGDMVTVLLQDGSKVTLKKDDIEQQIASLVSVMPDKLLDQLTKQEIADLFAYLESEPTK